MQTAATPPNEEERLNALMSYDILDTPEEQDFDDLVKLAANICETPIAVITMVDSNRQWFKSKIGLDVAQTPREIGFCAHVINQSELFIVPDATKDQRFHDNPIVTGEPYVRFYAGSPLITPQGIVIGTLCAIDKKPRTLRPEQLNALRTLSRQVITQMELRRTNARLQETNKQIAKNHELLNRARRHKTYFLSKMSHEIRTPLNGILGMAELLYTTTQDQQQRHYTQIIANSGRMLNKQINDIIDFSAMDNNKLQLKKKPLELESTLANITDMFRFRSLNKNVNLIASIAPSTPKFLVGDGPRIQQILINFIANAFKFTPQGEIVVRLTNENTKDASDDCHLLCRVSDTGVGIPEETLNSVFQGPLKPEMFSQNGHQGVGIGLSICRQLVNLMDGEIGAYHNEDRGTTFWFRVKLPYATTKDKRKLPHMTELTNKRLLVVDDNVTYGETVCEQACTWGMKPHFTTDPNDAMALIYSATSQDTPYDLIVLDHTMDSISGIDLSAAIQQNPTFRTIPRLLLSNTSPLPAEEQLFNTGISLARTKPATISQLNRDFAKLIGIKHHDPFERVKREINKKQGRVLVADDNPVNRMVLQGMLEKLSLSACLVENGEKAFEEFKKRPDDYQLILMDCDMPVMDGYDAARKIRAHEAQHSLKPIGIIAITAHLQEEQLSHTNTHGMNEYVHKPIRIRDIERLLAQWNRDSIERYNANSAKW